MIDRTEVCRAAVLLAFALLFTGGGVVRAQDAEAPGGADAPDLGEGEETPDLGEAEDAPDLDEDEGAPDLSEGEDFGDDDGGDDLDALLGTEVAPGSTGSFGDRLTKYGVTPYVHAYLTFEFANYEQATASAGSPRKNPQGKPTGNTFDLHYFNVFIGANIQDTVFAEIQLEHEHGAEDLTVRFAQVDVKFHEYLTLRAGLWLVPFGTYNEFLYPEFISKTPRGPLLSGGPLYEIIPSAWNDVGVQLRGKVGLGEALELNYVAYICNGLEQEDTTGVAFAPADGGRIRDMRKNFRDRNDGHKSVGGRLGVKFSGLSLGTSIYHGAYTEDGNQTLTLYGFDAQLEWGDLSIGIEYVAAEQTRRGSALGGGHDLHKRGGYAWIAYKFRRVLGNDEGSFALDVEPALAVDWVRLGGGHQIDLVTTSATFGTWVPIKTRESSRRGYLVGVNVYPFPQVLPNLNWRFFYGAYDNNGQEERDNIFITQLTLGF